MDAYKEQKNQQYRRRLIDRSWSRHERREKKSYISRSYQFEHDYQIRDFFDNKWLDDQNQDRIIESMNLLIVF